MKNFAAFTNLFIVFLGPGLAFIDLPQAFAELPGSNFFSIIFFAMLFIVGFNSMVRYFLVVHDLQFDFRQR